MKSINPSLFLPYQKRERYPGMLPKDAEVYNQLIKQHPKLFTSVIFNFRVGEGITYIPINSPQITRMAKMITQLRIDVLGVTDNAYYLIELKPVANVAAVGQLVSYEHLLRKQITFIRPLLPVVVCFYCPQDIQTVLDHLGYSSIILKTP